MKIAQLLPSGLNSVLPFTALWNIRDGEKTKLRIKTVRKLYATLPALDAAQVA